MYSFTGNLPNLVLHSNPDYRSPRLILREWSSLFPDGRQSLGNTKRRFHSNVLLRLGLDCPRCLLDLSSLVTVTEGSLLTGQSGIVVEICRRRCRRHRSFSQVSCIITGGPDGVVPIGRNYYALVRRTSVDKLGRQCACIQYA